MYTNPFLFPHTAAHTTAFKLLASCWLRLCRARSSHLTVIEARIGWGGVSSYLSEHMITLLWGGAEWTVNARADVKTSVCHTPADEMTF